MVRHRSPVRHTRQGDETENGRDRWRMFEKFREIRIAESLATLGQILRKTVCHKGTNVYNFKDDEYPMVVVSARILDSCATLKPTAHPTENGGSWKKRDLRSMAEAKHQLQRVNANPPHAQRGFSIVRPPTSPTGPEKSGQDGPPILPARWVSADDQKAWMSDRNRPGQVIPEKQWAAPIVESLRPKISFGPAAGSSRINDANHNQHLCRSNAKFLRILANQCTSWDRPLNTIAEPGGMIPNPQIRH
jgi:hypothetical protein